ncbi:MAG: DUF6160 family protein [Smithella sp.]
MKKLLPGHNFTGIIPFISILLLFFAVSVNDPVYAKMPMDDDSLAQIEGQEGITIGLNLTVSTVVNGFSFSNDSGQSINIGSIEIGDGAGGGFGVNTNLTLDIGTNTIGTNTIGSDNQTWVYLSGLVIPSTNTGICISANDITITANSTTWTLGDLDITGLYMGRSLTTITPNYIAGAAPWLMLGADSYSGIAFYAGMGMYINNVMFAYSSTEGMNISGIYIYGASPTNLPASGNPANWPALTGNAQIGGIFNTYAADGTINGTYNAGPATLDVGSNSSNTNGTEISLNLPMALSVRVKDVQMNSTDFGPMALDNLILYRNTITFRNL